ncbi:MAG: outer membrane lipoprotein carrier protein LolA [Pseudomonadota bacterium]
MMTRRLLISAALATAMVGFAQPGSAQRPLTLDDQLLVARVQGYLDGLTTLQARFSQISPDGEVVQGDFYLQRPGLMRLEYDTEPYLYVANGRFIYFYDEAMGSRSNTEIGETLADFILREDVRLSGNVTVMDIRSDPQAIQLDLIQTQDPTAGQMTLIFDADPIALSSWVVIDAQYQTTQVILDEIERDIDIPRSLFRAPEP